MMTTPQLILLGVGILMAVTLFINIAYNIWCTGRVKRINNKLLKLRCERDAINKVYNHLETVSLSVVDRLIYIETTIAMLEHKLKELTDVQHS